MNTAAIGKFVGGPADGVSLRFLRLPLYLRITRDPNGKWDVLDQPEDSPTEDEEVFAYRLHGDISVLHIDAVEHGRRVGRWIRSAEFHFVPDQPPDGVMRDHQRWVSWAIASVPNGRF